MYYNSENSSYNNPYNKDITNLEESNSEFSFNTTLKIGFITIFIGIILFQQSIFLI